MNKCNFLVCTAAIVMTLSQIGHGASKQASLSESFSDSFRMGAALNRSQILNEEPGVLEFVSGQFNALTPENVMKWEKIQALENQFDWEAADALVKFSGDHGMYLSGHVLVWHQQTPAWVFTNAAGAPASREQLLARMEKHINTVVGRYKGRVDAWEVVNEALNEDGSLRQTPWLTIIGEDYLEKAFEFAHRADPDAHLYYNDYNMYKPQKREGAVRLIQQLRKKGLTVHGVGMQGHYGVDNPKNMSEFEDSIKAFSELALAVHITELDVSVLPFPDQANWGADLGVDLDLNARFNPYSEGLPADVEQAQINQYVKLFKILLEHSDHVSRVTFWGISDAHSWKNGWPMRGRTDYPLLFGRNLEPKRVFYEVIELND